MRLLHSRRIVFVVANVDYVRPSYTDEILVERVQAGPVC